MWICVCMCVWVGMCGCGPTLPVGYCLSRLGLVRYDLYAGSLPSTVHPQMTTGCWPNTAPSGSR